MPEQRTIAYWVKQIWAKGLWGRLIILVGPFVAICLCCPMLIVTASSIGRRTPTPDVNAMRTGIAKTIIAQSAQTEAAKPTIAWTPTLTLVASLTYTPAPTSAASETPIPTSTAVAANRPTVDAPTVEPTSAYPPGATGICNDGTYTYAVNHRGACSRYGGVLRWLP